MLSVAYEVETPMNTVKTGTPMALFGAVGPMPGGGMMIAPGLGLATNLFSTHPATENRIAALHALAQEMAQELRMAPQAGFVSQTQPSPWGSTTRCGPWG